MIQVKFPLQHCYLAPLRSAIVAKASILVKSCKFQGQNSPRFFKADLGGGGLGQSKKSLSEKTEVVKKGGGGGLSFFTKSKKKQFFYGSPYVQIGQGIQNLGPLEIVEQCRGHWCTRGSKGAPGGSRVPPAPKRVIKQQNNGPKPWFKVPSVSRGIWVH